MNETYADLTIIIPTLDEEENIVELLDILEKKYPDAKKIVSDESSDRTQELVKKRKNKHEMLIDRTGEKIHGLTASVIDGILHTQTAFFIVIDGDLQHPPENIREVYHALQLNDLVVGTRRKVLSEWKLQRKLMSKIANTLAHLRVMHTKVKDPMSGFFGMRTELAKEIIKNHKRRFEMEGYKILFDLLKSTPKRTRIREVYYDFGKRAKGKSKIRFKHTVSFIKAVFK